MPLKQRKAVSYIWLFLRVGALQYVPQNIHRCVGLDRNSREKTLIVNVADELLWARLLIGLLLGALGRRREGGLVVEAV